MHAATSYGISIVLGILAILILLTRSQIGGLLWTPVYSLESKLAATMQIITTPFYSKSELVSENNALRADLAEAEAEDADRNALAQQNQLLKAELGQSGNPHVQGIYADIIARPPEIPYDTLILDAGTSNGIAVGDIVGSGSAAIGVIADAMGSNSRVVLFSSPGQSMRAVLPNGTPIIVQGAGGGTLTAQVPQGTAAAAGDTTVLPGAEMRVSAVVQGIEIQKNTSITVLKLALPANIFTLPYVTVWQQQLQLPAVPTATSSRS